MFDLNKQLSFPMFAQRIAVISSATAAGYGDFCDQLANNPYGFAFTTTLFPATMQGEGVEQSIIARLNGIYDCVEDFDCVVIIRGGGASSDLSGFDSLPLAENIANFPLPVITGIGHDRDETIADMVAHSRVKTPTAAAALLIDNLCDTAARIQNAQQRIYDKVKATMQREEQRIARLSQLIPTMFSLVSNRQQSRIDMDEGCRHAPCDGRATQARTPLAAHICPRPANPSATRIFHNHDKRQGGERRGGSCRRRRDRDPLRQGQSEVNGVGKQITPKTRLT